MPIYPKKTIYLAGPISGLTYKDARYGWRVDFENLLGYMNFDHIYCFSPMRGKDFLKDVGKLTSDCKDYINPMATPAGIMTRDFNDIKMCDAMVACFIESNDVPSLGTAVEYGIAYTMQKPVITIGKLDDPNVKHAMLNRITGYHVETLEEAVHVLGYLLTPGI